MIYLCRSLYFSLSFSLSLHTLSLYPRRRQTCEKKKKESHHHQPHQTHYPKMTPLYMYPLTTTLLLLTHQSLAAPNDQHQQQQQKPPHVTARAIQAARRNSAKITSPPLPLSLSLSSSTSAPQPPSCPTTLTVENRPGCGGCTITEYATTLTQSVDCGGGGDGGDGERCESLVTSTLYHRAFGICPVSFFFFTFRLYLFGG